MSKNCPFCNMKNTELTFVLQAIGSCRLTFIVEKVLAPFLDHEDPLLREGAIRGFDDYIQEFENGEVEDSKLDAKIINKIKDMKDKDSNGGVRFTAESFFE